MTAPAAAEAPADTGTCTYRLWLSKGAVDPAYAVLTLTDALDAFGLLQVSPLVLEVTPGGTYAVAACRPS